MARDQGKEPNAFECKKFLDEKYEKDHATKLGYYRSKNGKNPRKKIESFYDKTRDILVSNLYLDPPIKDAPKSMSGQLIPTAKGEVLIRSIREQTFPSDDFDKNVVSTYYKKNEENRNRIASTSNRNPIQPAKNNQEVKPKQDNPSLCFAELRILANGDTINLPPTPIFKELVAKIAAEYASHRILAL